MIGISAGRHRQIVLWEGHAPITVIRHPDASGRVVCLRQRRQVTGGTGNPGGAGKGKRRRRVTGRALGDIEAVSHRRVAVGRGVMLAVDPVWPRAETAATAASMTDKPVTVYEGRAFRAFWVKGRDGGDGAAASDLPTVAAPPPAPVLVYQPGHEARQSKPAPVITE